MTNWCWTSFQLLINHWDIFGKMSLWILCSFLRELFVFYWVVIVLYIIGYKSLITNIICQYILPLYGSYFNCIDFLWSRKILIFIKTNLSALSFVILCFWCYIKDNCLNWVHDLHFFISMLPSLPWLYVRITLATLSFWSPGHAP